MGRAGGGMGRAGRANTGGEGAAGRETERTVSLSPLPPFLRHDVPSKGSTSSSSSMGAGFDTALPPAAGAAPAGWDGAGADAGVSGFSRFTTGAASPRATTDSM